VANNEGGTFGNGVIVVKNWQVAVSCILYFVLAVAFFQQLHDHDEDSRRRIEVLEARPVVTQTQYEQGQKALTDCLTRIEDKLDNFHAKK